MNAVKELGKRLAARLDEDDWGYIEPFLNECETELESLRQQLAECQAELQSTRLQMITDFGQYQEAHEKVKELTDQVLAASNLLAVMHRDGGHHQLAVGFDQAIQDAMAVYYELTSWKQQVLGVGLGESVGPHILPAIKKLTAELEDWWREAHDEACTNMEDCTSFGGTKQCFRPHPSILKGQSK